MSEEEITGAEFIAAIRKKRGLSMKYEENKTYPKFLPTSEAHLLKHCEQLEEIRQEMFAIKDKSYKEKLKVMEEIDKKYYEEIDDLENQYATLLSHLST
jgi:signal recognition particle subunit SEC65